jgi:DNA-binding NarL/FixJ family response regulator
MLDAINTKSVFVVEDAPSIRERLTAMLQETAGIEVIGQADNPQSAIQGILTTKPDSVVLDIQLLGGSGLEVLRAVHPVLPKTVFIMLTNFPSEQYRQKCLASGAMYFLDKNSEFLKVLDAVHNNLH